MKAIIIGPYPGRTTGFVRVAVNVARQLMRHGWSVTYLAADRVGPRPAPADLDVMVLAGTGDIISAVTRIIEPIAPCQRIEVVCFGHVWYSTVIGALLDDQTVRARVRLSVYFAVDHAPVDPDVTQLADRFDRVIPSSRFGETALADLMSCDPAIPHGVNPELFRPRTAAERSAFRHEMFGPDEPFVVGYFGRNCGHKRPDLALRVFAHVANGTAVRCSSCAHVTVHELDTDGAPTIAAVWCRACGGDRVEPEPARRLVMYLHTDIAHRRMWTDAGGWDLPLLVERLGVGERVHFAELSSPDQGGDDSALVDSMNGCDVHLMLSEGAGWELTVLETAACGVPNIVTDHAAPAEYAGPFSRLIPPAYFQVDGRGCRAIADLDAAVGALIGLYDDPAERAALAVRGPEVAARYSWDQVGDLWHERLSTENSG